MVAEKAINAKSDFLSKMSHDMRTPMNGIIGLAMIAEKYRHDPDRMKEYFSKITVASHHLLGLINDVLDMSENRFRARLCWSPSASIWCRC